MRFSPTDRVRFAMWNRDPKWKGAHLGVVVRIAPRCPGMQYLIRWDDDFTSYAKDEWLEAA